MKLRKTLISIFAMLLVVSSLQITAYADEDHYYNFYADLFPYNSDCLELDTLKDVKDAKLTITKNDDPTITATIDLKYDPDPYWRDMWGIDYQDTPQMQAILADLSQKMEGKANSLRMKKSIQAMHRDKEKRETTGVNLRTKTSFLMLDSNALEGYTITVSGLGDHFEAKDFSASITTAESIQTEIDEYVDAIRNSGKTEYKNYVQPETYSQLMEDFAKSRGYSDYQAMLKDYEYEDDEISDEMELIQERDQILLDINNGTFYGQLDISGYMYCDCPEKTFYWIEHRYYKEIDGKRTMIYSNEEELNGYIGDVLVAKDFAKLEHDGQSYELVASYEYFGDKEVEQITLTDDTFGLILCYDYVGSDSEAGNGAVDNSDASDDQQDKPNRKPEVVTGEDGPDTGDYTPAGVYLIFLLLAAGACTALAAYKKR